MAGSGALSHSSVHTYLECPLRWKFLYVDKLTEAARGYFSFGRTVHSVLEELLRPYLVPGARITASGDRQRTLLEFSPHAAAPDGHLMTPKELLATYERLWVSDGYVSAEEEARYRSLGADLLLRYRETLERERPAPVAVEAHLEARWDGIPIHGYLDRIDRTPNGGLEILDYKTSREMSAAEAMGSDQLALYQVLVQKNFPEPVESLTLYHLRSLKPFRTPPRKREVLESLHERVGTVRDGIRSQAFEPKPGRQCGRCEFKDRCPEFRAVPAAERDRLAELVDRFARLRQEESRLDGELRQAAEALHREAERLGVHRFAGQSATAIRQREEAWTFSADAVRPILEANGLQGRIDPQDPHQVRKLLRDSALDEAVRQQLAGTGGKSVRWFWSLEPPAAE
jgi:putative RecB family exonuclease